MSDNQNISSVDQTVNTGPPLAAESAETNYFLAAVLGVTAAAAGAGVWYGLVVMTNMMIGYVAVGIGFLVGFAVKYGAGRGTFGLQILGAVLALLSIAGGDYFMIHYWIREEDPTFTQWLDLGTYLNEYIAVLKENPLNLLFYAIAVYEGYILPKADDLEEVVVPD